MDKEALVILRYYNLASKYNFLKMFGLKIYHKAIEFDGREYSFCRLNSETSEIVDYDPGYYGVFSDKAKSKIYNSKIENLGYIDRREFYKKLKQIESKYRSTKYNFIFNNCNDFIDDFIRLLFNGMSNPPRIAKSKVRYNSFIESQLIIESKNDKSNLFKQDEILSRNNNNRRLLTCYAESIISNKKPTKRVCLTSSIQCRIMKSNNCKSKSNQKSFEEESTSSSTNNLNNFLDTN